jgi:hypothetical protein
MGKGNTVAPLEWMHFRLKSKNEIVDSFWATSQDEIALLSLYRAIPTEWDGHMSLKCSRAARQQDAVESVIALPIQS